MSRVFFYLVFSSFFLSCSLQQNASRKQWEELRDQFNSLTPYESASVSFYDSLEHFSYGDEGYEDAFRECFELQQNGYQISSEDRQTFYYEGSSAVCSIQWSESGFDKLTGETE